jgi:hypothetical protein
MFFGIRIGTWVTMEQRHLLTTAATADRAKLELIG